MFFSTFRKEYFKIINTINSSSKIIIFYINNRYENDLPVIITTNYNREKLRERLACNKNYEIADSIISRLYEMCKGINITGKDKRKELV